MQVCRNIKYGQIFGVYTVGGAAIALLHRRPGYRAACLRGNEEAYLSMYISSIFLSTYTSILHDSRRDCGCTCAQASRIWCCTFVRE